MNEKVIEALRTIGSVCAQYLDDGCCEECPFHYGHDDGDVSCALTEYSPVDWNYMFL